MDKNIAKNIGKNIAKYNIRNINFLLIEMYENIKFIYKYYTKSTSVILKETNFLILNYIKEIFIDI